MKEARELFLDWVFENLERNYSRLIELAKESGVGFDDSKVGKFRFRTKDELNEWMYGEEVMKHRSDLAYIQGFWYGVSLTSEKS